jgi:hypothetical protein
MPGTSETDDAERERDLKREFSAEEKLERAEEERRRTEAPEESP